MGTVGSEGAASSLYHQLRTVYAPLLRTQAHGRAARVDQAMRDLEVGLGNALLEGPGAGGGGGGGEGQGAIASPMHEYLYWVGVAGAPMRAPRERACAAEVHPLLEPFCRPLAARADGAPGIEALGEDVLGLLDDAEDGLSALWCVRNGGTWAYSSQRMRGLMDAVGAVIEGHVLGCHERLNVWHAPFAEVDDALQLAVRVLSKWGHMVHMLTSLQWISGNHPHVFEGGETGLTTGRALQARVEDVLALRSAHEEIRNLLSAQEAAALSTGEAFGAFQQMHPFHVGEFNDALWKAAKEEYSRSMEPVEQRISYKLKEVLTGTVFPALSASISQHGSRDAQPVAQPYQVFQELEKYGRLFSRPLVAAAVEPECLTLLRHMESYLEVLRGEFEQRTDPASLARADPGGRGALGQVRAGAADCQRLNKNVSPLVSTLGWVVQCERKVGATRRMFETLNCQSPDAVVEIVSGTAKDLLKDIRAQKRSLFETWQEATQYHLEDIKIEKNEALDGLVVGRTDLLQRRIELQLAVLEDQLHFDRWEALVQEFEPVPVLVLQSLVKLAVPMQAPRALGSLRETELQAAKDAPHLLDGRGPPIFSAHQVSLHQHAHLVREDLVPFPQCPVLLCEFVGDALEAHHVAPQRSGVAPGDGLPHAVPRVRQNLFELHSVLKQHRLLAGDHLRRDVVVEVGHLLQHHPVPVELMRGGDFVLDLFRHGEAHGRELPCLLQERDQIVAVLQDDLAVLTFEVHQLPVLLDLDVLQMVLGGLLPRLEQGALLRPNVLQQVLGCAADDLHNGIRALTVQSLEHPAGGSDLPLALHHPAQGADQRRDVLVEPLAVRSPRPHLSERASAPGIRPGEAGGVRPLLELAPQDLQIALHVPQQREALGLHRRRHQRAGEQPAVLLKLLEYLVGLRDGLRIAAPVLGDGRTEGGEDSPREHLLELVADALFDGLHAPAVLLLGGLPQGVVELAHVERVHLLEGSEGLPGGQRRSLLRGQQVPDLLVRRAQRKDVFHAGLERPARRKARLAALEDVRVVPAYPLQAGEHVHHVTPLAQNPHCQLQGVVHFSEGCMPHVEALVAPQHVPFDDGPDGVHEAAHALRAVGPRPPVAHAPQRAQPVLRIIQEPQHVFPEGLDARGAVGARRQRAAEGLQQGVDLRGAGALPR